MKTVSCRSRSTLLCLTVAIAASVSASPRSTGSPLKFTFDVDDLKVWFNGTREQCNLRDAPDQSLAAFRKDDGSVMIYSGDNSPGGFFSSYGPSLFEVTRNCSAPALIGNISNLSPSVFPHNVWLMATWTEDGETVYGLVHDEFHANVTDSVTCPAADGTTCWDTTILAVKSVDGGHTFQYMRTPENPRAIAISSPIGYTPGVVGGRPQGMPNHHLVHDPKTEYLYLVSECAQGAHLPQFNQEGKCVWRTNDVSNISAWRGWDGVGWEVTVIDPYAHGDGPPPSSKNHLAAIVGSGIAGSGSVTFHEPTGMYIAMGSKLIANPDKNQQPIVHVFYQTATNITSWSQVYDAGTFVLPKPFFGCSTYPHLLDVHSPSRNFDRIGANSTSVYMQFNTGVPGPKPHVPGSVLRAGVAVGVQITLSS